MKWAQHLGFSFFGSKIECVKREPLLFKTQENTETTAFVLSVFFKQAEAARRKRKLFAFVSAIMLHLLLLILVLINFHGFSKTLNLGDEKSPAIHSYLYQGKLPKDAFIPEPIKSTVLNVVTDSENKISPQKIQPKKATASDKQPQVARKAQNSDAKGNTTDALLALLHNKIQAAQVYPSSALAMQRSGQAMVSFTLLLDGTVSGVQLVESSGTKSLDDAALAAVEHASPFQGVGQYLRASKNFEIAVSFELPEEN